MRDNLKSGEGNLANREDGKDMMLPNVNYLCIHHKHIEWNQIGFYEDLNKEF